MLTTVRARAASPTQPAAEALAPTSPGAPSQEGKHQIVMASTGVPQCSFKSLPVRRRVLMLPVCMPTLEGFTGAALRDCAFHLP